MSVIILLLAASLLISGIFLGAFIWSIRHEQYEDEYSPPRRILFEDGSLQTRQESYRDEQLNLSIGPKQKKYNQSN
jgi:cbb3-type cytochrome oxidase maturation protein